MRREGPKYDMHTTKGRDIYYSVLGLRRIHMAMGLYISVLYINQETMVTYVKSLV